MKLMIASDIHGSALYCRKLIEAYSAEKADRLLLLGDILYHGPRNNLPGEYEPKEVIAMLNEMKSDIMCVRGNCDTEVDQMVLDFPIMADYAVIPVGKRIIFATHGHNYNTSNVPSVKKGDILLHGHTHIPKCEEFGDGLLYLNPGSVSIPKNNSAHSYIIFENNLFEWKNLDGNTYMSYNL
ncbi:MAG: phosphodiesterase [Oscillospiraceae bacterium]|nr:phosphodiesterase [Oscillospiraceae bacterium]